MNVHLKYIRPFALSICVLLTIGCVHAASYTWVDHDHLVGQLQTVQIQPGDNFFKIARRYDVGFYELVEANPQINPESPQVGSMLVVPTQYILPVVHQKTLSYSGIVINIAEMRLYFFPSHAHTVYTFPIGIGRQGASTPLGSATIIEKRKHPYWVVPSSIRKAKEAEGVFLPYSLPPSDNNPLGHYAMRLSWPTYLIHSTNVPQGIGRRSSSGCIRMFPEDMKQLFSMVLLHSKVQIVDRPYKFGWHHNVLFLEAHTPLQETLSQTHQETLVRQATPDQSLHGLKIAANWDVVLRTAKAHLGIPLKIDYTTEHQEAKGHASAHTSDRHQNH